MKMTFQLSFLEVHHYLDAKNILRQPNSYDDANEIFSALRNIKLIVEEEIDEIMIIYGSKVDKAYYKVTLPASETIKLKGEFKNPEILFHFISREQKLVFTHLWFIPVHHNRIEENFFVNNEFSPTIYFYPTVENDSLFKPFKMSFDNILEEFFKTFLFKGYYIFHVDTSRPEKVEE